MRPAHLVFLMPVLLQAVPPAVPLEDATVQILEAFDLDPSPGKLPTPPVHTKDRPARDWLLSTLREDLPKNPFHRGTPPHREAESIRALLRAAPGDRAAGIKSLPLTLAGTQAALWRWGQALVRKGEMTKPLRHTWEDRLLAKGGALVIRGWALRHAFCFALAEADEARLANLKESCEEEIPDLTKQFQRAFALLGGPPPRIYLWSLPDLEALDIPLNRLGQRIYIVPLEPGGPAAPEDCAWIIPCVSSNLPIHLSVLEDASLEEARHLAAQTRSMGRRAYLAPSRAPLEACALAYFPIDIRLNTQGLIQSIRMGDAALAK
jgi:hypothetical protein